MNWREFIDTTVGNRPTFTNQQVRDIVQRTLIYTTDNWVNKNN